jgi:hypothetical protein
LAVAERAIAIKPAMAELLDLAIPQFNPAEVTQLSALVVAAVAGHEGGVEISGAAAVGAAAEPITLAALETVVHVAKHHQGHRSMPADLIDRQG